MKKLSYIISTIAVSLVLSCGDAFFSEEDMLRISDKIPPSINLSNADDTLYYASVIEVTGRTTDLTDDGEAGKVVGLVHYEISAYNISGTVMMDTLGKFQISIPAGEITGTVSLKIYVYDWNNNRGEIKVPVRNEVFNSFQCFPENKKITLVWESVTRSTDYTLYYTDNNSMPSTENWTGREEQVVSPLVLEKLKNGKKYSFLLKAEYGDDQQTISEIHSAVPLSGFTLAPKVTGKYGEMEIRWIPVPGAETYNIFRATSKNGPYSMIAGQLAGSVFTDTDVTEREYYYYKIAPALEGSPVSYANGAETIPFTQPGVLLDSDTTPGVARDVAINGDFAYVADDDNGVQVFDISTPDNPEWIHTIEITGSANNILVKNAYAYIAAGPGGLSIADISDPGSAAVIGETLCTTKAEEVVIKGNYAYIAAREDGVPAVNISDKTNPFKEGSFRIDGMNAMGIDIKDNTLFIADYNKGLLVLDIASPAIPSKVNEKSTSGYAEDVVVKEDFAYIANGEGGLYVINISDLDELKYQGNCVTTGYACGVAVAGHHVWLAGGKGGVSVINVSEMLNASFFDFFDGPIKLTALPTYDQVDNPRGLALKNGYAYVAAGFSGLKTLHAKKPDALIEAGLYNPSQKVSGVAVREDLTYLTLQDRGMVILDTSDPGNPVYKNEAPLTGILEDVVLSGPFAFLTGNRAGVHVVNIENSDDLQILPMISIPGKSNFFYLAADYAYIPYNTPGGDKGIYVLDISDPYMPVEIRTYEAPSFPSSVAVEYEHLYVTVTESTMGICIYTADPETPPEIINTEDEASDIEIRGTYAYIADGTKGLTVIDLKNTSNSNPPFFDPPGSGGGNALDLELSGHYAYIADTNNGLQIVDIYEPQNPQYAGSYISGDAMDNAVNIAVSGKYAYIAYETGGLKIVDLWPFQ